MTKQPRPRLCPNPQCRVLVGRDTTECYECGANLSSSSRAFYDVLAWFTGPDGGMPWWKLVLALNIGLYLIGLVLTKLGGYETGGGMMNLLGASQEVHLRLGLQTPPLLAQGEWWRMITSTFLHAGIIHIGLNMYFLTQLGPAAEREFGGWGFLIIYILGGLAGSAVEWWLGEASLGASGSVLALIGAVAGLGMVRMRRNGFPWSRSWDNPLTKEMLKILLIITVFGIFIGGVAHGAHIGGFVAGAILLFLVDKLGKRQFRKILVALGVASALLVVGSMTLMAVTPGPGNISGMKDCAANSLNLLLDPEKEPIDMPACLEREYGKIFGEDSQPLVDDIRAVYHLQHKGATHEKVALARAIVIDRHHKLLHTLGLEW